MSVISHSSHRRVDNAPSTPRPFIIQAPPARCPTCGQPTTILHDGAYICRACRAHAERSPESRVLDATRWLRGHSRTVPQIAREAGVSQAEAQIILDDLADEGAVECLGGDPPRYRRIDPYPVEYIRAYFDEVQAAGGTR